MGGGYGGRDNSLTGTNNDRPVQIVKNPYPANQRPQQWILPLGADRFEAFNAINHVNLSNPSTNLSSSNFGTITSAGDPRILQFAMKLHW